MCRWRTVRATILAWCPKKIRQQVFSTKKKVSWRGDNNTQSHVHSRPAYKLDFFFFSFFLFSVFSLLPCPSFGVGLGLPKTIRFPLDGDPPTTATTVSFHLPAFLRDFRWWIVRKLGKNVVEFSFRSDSLFYLLLFFVFNSDVTINTGETKLGDGSPTAQTIYLVNLLGFVLDIFWSLLSLSIILFFTIRFVLLVTRHLKGLALSPSVQVGGESPVLRQSPTLGRARHLFTSWTLADCRWVSSRWKSGRRRQGGAVENRPQWSQSLEGNRDSHGGKERRSLTFCLPVSALNKNSLCLGKPSMHQVGNR